MSSKRQPCYFHVPAGFCRLDPSIETSNSPSTNVAIINPYKYNYRYAAAQLQAKEVQVLYGKSSQATNYAVAATMGIQSQNSGGAVKKCKKG